MQPFLIFLNLKEASKSKQKKLKNIFEEFVYFGGSDVGNKLMNICGLALHTETIVLIHTEYLLVLMPVTN